MSEDKKLDNFMSRYLALAKKSKEESRMIFNHVCIRVDDIDEAEKLLCDSFGLDSFLRPGGETFDSEKEFRVSWLNDNNMYLELSEFDDQQKIGYDTGVGQPIGHLSEIGFFVPTMEKALADLSQKGWEVTSSIEIEGAKMYKVNNRLTPGIPVELIDYQAEDWQP
jgi:catechol 2,3-dioxygenase-like lactoylglutathione lyase family enzyme